MLKGIIPSPDKLTKKAVMMAITVPEGAIMLTIAIFLDGSSMVLFVLSLCGVGIPLTWLLTIMGSMSIGFWAVARPFYRNIISNLTENITNKMMNIGGGLEGIQKFQGADAQGLEAGKKMAKTGAKVGISVVRFLITLVIKLIPFLNNIFPTWTIMVIFELVEGEV